MESDRVAPRVPHGEDLRSEPGGVSSNLSLSQRCVPQRLVKTPPCSRACASGGDVRGWIGMIAQRRKLGWTDRDACARAWAALVATNPFPATLGRICPHPCELACERAGTDGPVAIRALERFLGDWALRQGFALPILETGTQPESIGVVGAGPAGLSFAYQMARRGYRVTLYEKREKPGGMLSSVVPRFRLPGEVVDAEIRRLLDVGIDLRLRVAIGRDVTVEQLRDRHSVLFFGNGAVRGVRLNVPGERGEGAWLGVDYLSDARRGHAAGLGTRVVVIGGGNTAVDAARVARRNGAEVTILYRRTRREMPASTSEVGAAVEEGVVLQCLCVPVAIARDGCGAVAGVMATRVRSANRSGPPDHCAQAPFVIAADCVIAAVSQLPDWGDIAPIPLPAPNDGWRGVEWHGVRVHFGGDVLAPGIAGAAIAQGRQAAETAHAQLRGLPNGECLPPEMTAPPAVKAEHYASRARTRIEARPANERLVDPDAETEQTLSEQAFLGEATRCFSCGRCFGCELCFMYCNASAISRLEEPEPGYYMALDPDRCEGCGKCVDLCPCGFLTNGSLHDVANRKEQAAHRAPTSSCRSTTGAGVARERTRDRPDRTRA